MLNVLKSTHTVMLSDNILKNINLLGLNTPFAQCHSDSWAAIVLMNTTNNSGCVSCKNKFLRSAIYPE